MGLAIYRLEARSISRGQGRSCVAAAAYRHACALSDRRQNMRHDYRRKAGVLHSEILAPRHAPAWMKDREELWNGADAAEKRRDAITARELLLSLPRELSKAQNVRLVRAFVDDQATVRGLVADVAIHSPDGLDGQPQPHAHVMLTDRDVTPEGQFAKRKPAWLSRPEHIQAVREAWADHCNRALEAAGLEERVDHRSVRDRNRAAIEADDRAEIILTDRLPEPKIGPRATRMVREGRGGEALAWAPVSEIRADRAWLQRKAAEYLEAAMEIARLEAGMAKRAADERKARERKARERERQEAEKRREIERARRDQEIMDAAKEVEGLTTFARWHAAEAQRARAASGRSLEFPSGPGRALQIDGRTFDDGGGWLSGLREALEAAGALPPYQWGNPRAWSDEARARLWQIPGAPPTQESVRWAMELLRQVPLFSLGGREPVAALVLRDDHGEVRIGLAAISEAPPLVDLAKGSIQVAAAELMDREGMVRAHVSPANGMIWPGRTEEWRPDMSPMALDDRLLALGDTAAVRAARTARDLAFGGEAPDRRTYLDIGFDPAAGDMVVGHGRNFGGEEILRGDASVRLAWSAADRAVSAQRALTQLQGVREIVIGDRELMRLLDRAAVANAARDHLARFPDLHPGSDPMDILRDPLTTLSIGSVPPVGAGGSSDGRSPAAPVATSRPPPTPRRGPEPAMRQDSGPPQARPAVPSPSPSPSLSEADRRQWRVASGPSVRQELVAQLAGYSDQELRLAELATALELTRMAADRSASGQALRDCLAAGAELVRADLRRRGLEPTALSAGSTGNPSSPGRRPRGFER